MHSLMVSVVKASRMISLKDYKPMLSASLQCSKNLSRSLLGGMMDVTLFWPVQTTMNSKHCANHSAPKPLGFKEANQSLSPLNQMLNLKM